MNRMELPQGAVPILGKPPEMKSMHFPGPMAESVGTQTPVGDNKVLVLTRGGRTRLEVVATELIAASVAHGEFEDDDWDGKIVMAFDLAEKIVAEADKRMCRRPEK